MPGVRPATGERSDPPRRLVDAARAGAALVVASTGLLAAACTGDGGSESPTPTNAVAAGAPTEVAANPDDWVLPGADYDNSRTAGASAIDSGTVRRLELAWRRPMEGSLSTVPIVAGDTVYVQDGRGVVAALDRATGEARWQSEPSGFNIGPFGAAVADGRVFALSGSTGVVALDAATGAHLWARDLVATPTTGIDIQPVVHDGVVFVSTVPVSVSGIYTGGDQGVLHALDAETGADLWTFDTVEEGFWGNPQVNSGGGAWYPPVVDEANGQVVWGVANPAPFPGTEEFPNGSSRPGENLYTNSAVALDLATGDLRWYHQVHPHDLFDRDLVHTLIARPPDADPVLVAAGKGAVVVGLDPANGELMWNTPVGRHENDDLTALDGPTLVAPGTFGGILTPPATAEGVVFAATVDAPTTLEPDRTAYFGADMGQNPGSVVAVDARTGEVLWETDVPGDPLGGATVVNDLVLTATLQGTLVALDRSDGDIVWRTETGGGINGWMTVSGDLLVVPMGVGAQPEVVAYRLG